MKADADRMPCIRMFETMATEAPTRPAVEAAGRSISYGELLDQARALAAQLVSLGIGADDVVAIDLPRGIGAILATLGVNFAGAASLALGPHLPAERIRAVVSEASAKLIIRADEAIAAPRGLGIAELGIAQAIARGADVAVTLPRPAAHDLAYVISTSGSTGVPKTIAIEHGGLAHLCRWFHRFFATTRADRFSQVAALSFDASMWEIWPALTCGACLCITPDAARLSPPALLEWLTQTAISVCWLPTIQISEMFRMPPAALAKVRLPRVVTTAGEKLTRCAPAHFPGQVYNCYGPSEDTVCTTVALVPIADDDASASVEPPIGLPIDGKGVLLLDGNGKPVPDGVAGEMFLYGAGLARGYLNRPEFTAERFVVRDVPGLGTVRLFRSGDLAWRDVTDDLHFIGRADNQVNLHGYRVELSEIEHALLQRPEIAEAIVLVDNSTGYDPALVAHVVAQGGVEVVAADIRHELGSVLPYYMVPSAIFAYEVFPTTAHGKVDRKRLRRRAEIEAVPASGEATMATLIRSILGSDVDMRQSFIATGGNSVAAIRLAAEIERLFGFRLSVAELLDQPTLAALCASIADGSHRGTGFAVMRRETVPDGHQPAAPSQELLWFLNKLKPDNPAYVAKAMVFLRGELDVAVLRASLQSVVDRHEIYRTTFAEGDGELIQRVHPCGEVPFEVVSEAIDVADIERASEELLLRRFSAPFQLDRLPLARFALVSVDPRLHVLFQVEHHIIHDGWSFNLFVAELFDTYRHVRAGRTPPAPEVYQFADFVAAQRMWRQSAACEQQRRYWQAKLASAPALLELPGVVYGGEADFAGATAREVLPRAMWQKCEALARSHGVTPFSLLLAVFTLVLGRYAGVRDVCVGSAFANRNWRNAESVLGMLVNTVVLRNSFEDGQPFDAFVAAVGETVSGALANQELPFAEVVKGVNPPRRPGVSPLFQAFLGFHDAPMADLGTEGLKVSVIEGLGNNAAKFPLSLLVIPRVGQSGGDDPVHLVWEYDTALLPRSLFERLAGSFRCALDSILARPAQPVGSIPLVGRDQQAALVRLLCPPPEPSPPLSPERHVARLAALSPDRAAVECVDDRLSYGELARRTARLAGELAQAGIRPGDRVAVALRRRCHLVVAVLAIQRLGACYVPVDPRYPGERIRYVLDDAAVRLLITESAVAPSLPSGSPTLFVDRPGDVTAGVVAAGEAVADDAMAGAAPAAASAAHRAAYVLYTSGSTGRPNGVVISQAAFANFAHGIAQEVGLGEDDRLLAVTSLSFDIAGLELLVPLTLGAQVVIADEDSTLDGRALADLIARNHLTVMQATPATWRLLLAAGWRSPARFKALCGGEAMPRALAGQLLDAGAELFNLYGPTETTVWSTVHRVRRTEGHSVPIGRAIANTQLFVLDDAMAMVPQGVAGQLYIGGAGLADGYLGRAELTARRFVHNPYLDVCPWSTARLYATGDSVRIDEAGQLQYLSRLDHQVKVSGHRIEVGEIEATLETHSDVACAAVHAVADGDGMSMLVAHVVPREREARFDAPTLTAYLKARLPAHMVPRVISPLSRLPLTPNGKIDRRQLPTVAAAAPTRAFLPPRGETESVIAQAFCRTLGLAQVGAEDDFFALGGYSLQIARMLHAINDALATALKPRDLFSGPTVATLAAIAETHRRLNVLIGNDAFDAENSEEVLI